MFEIRLDLDSLILPVENILGAIGRNLNVDWILDNGMMASFLGCDDGIVSTQKSVLTLSSCALDLYA